MPGWAIRRVPVIPGWSSLIVFVQPHEDGVGGGVIQFQPATVGKSQRPQLAIVLSRANNHMPPQGDRRSCQLMLNPFDGSAMPFAEQRRSHDRSGNQVHKVLRNRFAVGVG